MAKPTDDEVIQKYVKIWVTQKVNSGQTKAAAFKDIIDNATQNIRQIDDQIKAKRLALKGVSSEDVEKALEPFYIVSRREKRTLINAKHVKDSGWATD